MLRELDYSTDAARGRNGVGDAGVLGGLVRDVNIEDWITSAAGGLAWIGANTGGRRGR